MSQIFRLLLFATVEDKKHLIDNQIITTNIYTNLNVNNNENIA